MPRVTYYRKILNLFKLIPQNLNLIDIYKKRIIFLATKPIIISPPSYDSYRPAR